MEKIDQLLQHFLEGLKMHGPKIIYALITLFIGLWIINRLSRLLKKIMVARNVDESLRSFFKSFFSISFKTLLVISVISMLGIQTTSFIAILGAAGLAIGMALSGMLQNFAGGVLILVLKPFKVGDYITAQGQSGTVKSIQIFNTVLKTPDNKTVIIPNGGLSTGVLVNFSSEETRRVDLIFGISYEDNIDTARGIIDSIIKEQEQIHDTPAPFIGVVELADSSVNLTVRVWVNSADYWAVFFYLQETVKKRFDKEGVTIPFPQRDIHVFEDKK